MAEKIAHKKSTTALNAIEKSVIKALLNDGWRNQDIQALINTGRPASINFARISGIKSDIGVAPATKQQVEAFQYKKRLFDHVTGLCPIDDERLVRAREAMILAVELFDTPRIAIKTGVFSMLANVAWTFLLHEFYERKGEQLVDDQGRSPLLSQMLKRDDCPLSKLCRQNLVALGEIRNVVEHHSIGPFDLKWLPLFQSTCLNFERTLTELFGQRLTLGQELGFALQFAKLGGEEIAALQEFELPQHIAALDASLSAALEDGEKDNLEYQFKVVYTLTSASKSKAHFQFIQPDSAEGKELQNILIKYKPIEDIWPFKPTEVISRVSKVSGRKFTNDKHTRAWKIFNVRPKTDATDPSNTDRKYSIYHPPYNSYTYSQGWVDFLIGQIANDEGWLAISNFVADA
jgi:hypothetical protein